MGVTLRMEGVRFGYSAIRPVVVDVNLTVAEGEAVALFGANGAGKTTVLRLAMGLLRPVGGFCFAAGFDTRVHEPSDLARQVGFMFQHPENQLFAPSVREEFAFGPRQLGWSAAEVDHRLRELLPRLGLADVAGTHPWDLPLPARRLVTLGCALMVRPALLLLDEPSAGLDRASKETLCRVLREEVARGVAVLAVTHDAAFAVEAFDRAIVMERGMTQRQGPVAEVLAADLADVPGLPPALAVLAGLGLAPAGARRADRAAALAQYLAGPRGA